MPGTNNKKQSLTKRQREIYEFLRDKIVNRGYGPTVREIGMEFNIRSPNGVMCHLKALERKGLISREQNMSRAIQLSDTPQNRMNIGLIGTASGLNPMQFAVSSDEHVSVAGLFEGTGVGCIRVEGNLFAAVSIAHGDLLIVNRELSPQPGCTVAALDDRHSLMLGTLQDTGGQLSPLVPGVHGGIARQVLGVVTGIVRRLRVPRLPGTEQPPAN